MISFKVPWTLVLPVVAFSIGTALPAVAQQSRQQQQFQSAEAYAQPTDQDRLRAAAAAINNRRSELFGKGDAAGIAAMYTANATYVELLPRLQMMEGHAQIEEHFRELFNAHATQLQSAVTSVRMIDNDTQLVGGDYFLVAKGKKIAGHFVQILRREGGTWKIASHVFARPEPVTVGEEDQYRG